MEPREYCELFFGPLSPDDNITLPWLVGKRVAANDSNGRT